MVDGKSSRIVSAQHESARIEFALAPMIELKRSTFQQVNKVLTAAAPENALLDAAENGDGCSRAELFFTMGARRDTAEGGEGAMSNNSGGRLQNRDSLPFCRRAIGSLLFNIKYSDRVSVSFHSPSYTCGFLAVFSPEHLENKKG